jgi:hypothetical protein
VTGVIAAHDSGGSLRRLQLERERFADTGDRAAIMVQLMSTESSCHAFYGGQSGGAVIVVEASRPIDRFYGM